MSVLYYIGAILFYVAFPVRSFAQPAPPQLAALSNPILFNGNDSTAYRDPAILYYNKTFYLFFTLVKTEIDRKVYSYVAMSHSKNLKNWSAIQILTTKDQSLDFSSPGNVIRYKNEWILCLQTYPRPDYTTDQMPKFGNGNARLFIMRSRDLKNWGKPELLKVKGTGTTEKEIGRMIDPYLLEDKDDKMNYAKTKL